MDSRELVARILSCPDCDSALNGDLICLSCGRSLAPQEDGIIDALPRALTTDHRSKNQIQTLIESSGPGSHGETVVLFEQAFHDEQAGHYDKLFADPLPLSRYYQNLVRRQIYSSFLHEQSFVVDLCCGTGKSSMPLIDQGLFVLGFDVSREMLRLYRRKSTAKGHRNVVLIHADASRPPLRPGVCGAITLIGGLHHIPDQPGCLATCCRALKPDGLLILHEPLKTGKTSRWATVLKDVYAITDPARVARSLARRMGVKSRAQTQVQTEPFECDFTPYEKPFRSPEELLAILPPEMQPVVLRSQGVLTFREFPSVLQNRMGMLFASVLVRLDEWLSTTGRAEWSGDALFAVLKKGTERESD